MLLGQAAFIVLETTAICVSPTASQVSAIALDSVESMDDWGLSPQVGILKVTPTGAFQLL